jgi:YD repeat-containing protein
MNRLTSEEEVWTNGQRLIRHYEYDYLGNRISSTDIYGNKTLYAYNDFSQLTKVTYPTQQAIEKEYDALGNVISLTDAKGAQSTASYTLHAKPYIIHYPDGSQESYEYNYKGQLKKKIFSNDTYTLYTPDYLGRSTEEKTYSADGTLLKTITRKYNAFHLKEEIDPAGHLTAYSYDGAGRLIRKTHGLQHTEYKYDTLGRVQVKKEYTSQDDYIATHYQYDKLDRLKQETVCNSTNTIFRKVTYAYDADGHRRETTSYPSVGPSTSTTFFNPHGDPITSTDAYGHTTSIHYHYPYAPIIETTDPLGRTTSIEKDALDREVAFEIKGASGELLKKYKYSYDTVGNRCSCVESSILHGSIQHEVLTIWKHDELNRVISQTEAADTPEQKTTLYSYTASGELKTKTKPDGVQLTYEYDPLNRLSLLTSTDNTIQYTYDYDLNDNLKCIRNPLDGTCTLREYDDQDRLIQETLANGLTIAYG